MLNRSYPATVTFPATTPLTGTVSDGTGGTLAGQPPFTGVVRAEVGSPGALLPGGQTTYDVGTGAYSLPVTNPTLMGRREVFARHPMRREFHISSDYDFFARAVEGCRSGCLREPLLSYRQHAGQVTQSERPEMVFHACLIRLVTARRRSGRPENLPELLASVGPWRERAPSPADASTNASDSLTCDSVASRNGSETSMLA